MQQAALARAQGFATQMRFIATESVDENVARVLQRSQGGGHGASERDIRAIHEASIANLGVALDVFDAVRVYDSTVRWLCRDWLPSRAAAASNSSGVALLGSNMPCLRVRHDVRDVADYRRQLFLTVNDRSRRCNGRARRAFVRR